MFEDFKTHYVNTYRHTFILLWLRAFIDGSNSAHDSYQFNAFQTKQSLFFTSHKGSRTSDQTYKFTHWHTYNINIWINLHPHFNTTQYIQILGKNFLYMFMYVFLIILQQGMFMVISKSLCLNVFVHVHLYNANSWKNTPTAYCVLRTKKKTLFISIQYNRFYI